MTPCSWVCHLLFTLACLHACLLAAFPCLLCSKQRHTLIVSVILFQMCLTMICCDSELPCWTEQKIRSGTQLPDRNISCVTLSVAKFAMHSQMAKLQGSLTERVSKASLYWLVQVVYQTCLPRRRTHTCCPPSCRSRTSSTPTGEPSSLSHTLCLQTPCIGKQVALAGIC